MRDELRRGSAIDVERLDARVVADSSQARPAQDAVSSGLAHPPAARRGHGDQVLSPARPDHG
jgi:hypothetical protein